MKKYKPDPGYGPLFWFLWIAHLILLIHLFSMPRITQLAIWQAAGSGLLVYAYLFITWRMRKARKKRERIKKVLQEQPISVPPPIVGRVVQEQQVAPPVEWPDLDVVTTHVGAGSSAVPPDWNEATQGPYVPFNVNNHRPTGREPAKNVQDALTKLDDFFRPR